VVEAAIALVDSEASASLTLAAVAGRLDVRSPSIYHHVGGGVAGLRRLVAIRAAEQLAVQLQEAVEGLPPEEAVWAVAHAQRTFAREHPGMYRSFLPAPAPTVDEDLAEALARPVDVVAGVLRRLGLPDHRLIPAIRALRSAVHGFVDLEARGGFGPPDGIDSSFDDLIRMSIAGILTEVGR